MVPRVARGAQHDPRHDACTPDATRFNHFGHEEVGNEQVAASRETYPNFRRNRYF